MAVGGVRVGSTVDGRSSRGDALVSPLGEQYQNSGYHRQHQYQTGDSDPDGEASLRYANGVWIVDCLKNYEKRTIKNLLINKMKFCNI